MSNSRKVLLSVMILALVTITVISNQYLVFSKEPATVAIKAIPELSLKHPRRGHQITLVGGKLWVTGGKSYQNHFLAWNEKGNAPFSVYPNVEIIDPVAKTVTYTKIPGSATIYESIAFTTSPTATTIYLAGINTLQKIDTQRLELTEIKDFGLGAKVDKNAPHQTGVMGETNKGYWGWMSIKGKTYTVLVAAKQFLFFDATLEKFVSIPGVTDRFPNQMSGGTVIDNKFYLFGGQEEGTDAGTKLAWVFDPNASPDNQLTRIADLPLPLSGPPKVEAVAGKAYIIGGSSRGNCLDTIIMYDPVSKTYTRKANLPETILNHDTCVVGDEIYISYGYAWGTKAEDKLGDRMHPPTILSYKPKVDDTVGSFAAKYDSTGKSESEILRNLVDQVVTDRLRLLEFKVDDMLKDLGGPERKEVRIHLVGIEQNTKEQTRDLFIREAGVIFKQMFTSDAPIELVTIYYHLPDRNNAFYVPGGRIVYKIAFTKQEAMGIDWTAPDNNDFNTKATNERM